jgi:hypothetical protein
VKYERTALFRADAKRLSRSEFEPFVRVVRTRFHPAAVGVAANPGSSWPRGLRVRSVEGAPGVWEMTWSISGPDGRATFEWIQIDGEPAIRWRRIGGHAIFGGP